ncbi:uncharacterized protein K02A2.6-like [Athalia rosae]|uniref:uncharacterized protein K02A2.6-like n=1 Tax=Athalia rosae TaxID=37344 RepID=UPI0020337B89|nr:uncharacterized protein K02A2.6-like [Athalia rosae]
MGDEECKVTKTNEQQIRLTDAQHFTQEEIISELRKRGHEVNPTEKRDDLRKKLVTLVRREIEERKCAEEIEERERAEEIEERERAEEIEERERAEESQQDSQEHSSIMTDNAHLTFHLKTDDWEAFVERMELHLVVKKITEDNMKVAILLTHFDEEAYILVRNLCAPAKPSTKSFDDIVKLMSDHINPKPSIVMERCTFNSTKQDANESISDFAARLRKLALHCDFTDLATALRDQFVCGLYNETARIELFKLSDLTFDKALTTATAHENAMKNAAGAVKTLSCKNQKQEMFAISRETNRRSHQSTEQQRNKRMNDKRCYCCGDLGHFAGACTHRDKTCNFCKKRGHLERACFKKKRAGNKYLQPEDDITPGSATSDGDHYDDFFSLRAKDNNIDCKLVVNNIKADPMFVDVHLNGKKILMEIDSGTYYTVVSERLKAKHLQNWKIDKCNTNLYGYEHNEMQPIGQLKNLKVNFNNQLKNLNCLVLKGDGPPSIGRQWLAEFNLWPLKLSDTISPSDTKQQILKLNVNNVQNNLLLEFPQLFGNTPGLYNKRAIKLHLKNNAKPIALGARHVPYALRVKVENEIARLITLGHLKKVEASEWATPIVPVIKKDGTVRICGDFKLTVNPNLDVTKRPFPLIDDIFQILQRGLLYSQLDLKHGYMQIPIDEKSQELLTITTHIGLFRYTKMTEGTAPAPGEFQQIMNECLQGIPHTVAYLDNIYVTGETHEEHLENLRKVCKRLEENGLRVNRDKCDFMKEQIEVLGLVIDAKGLHKSKSKIEAMWKAPRPSNSKQLLSFLGLINFYERFLCNRSEKLKPLFDCVRNMLAFRYWWRLLASETCWLPGTVGAYWRPKHIGFPVL